MSSFMLIHQVVSKNIMTNDWTIKYATLTSSIGHCNINCVLSVDQAFLRKLILVVPADDPKSSATTDDDNRQRKLMGIVLGCVGGILLLCLIIFGYLSWVHRRYVRLMLHVPLNNRYG